MQEVQAALPIGSVIRDRYVVESLLGKGGFGVVYLVSDLRVKGNQFALKEVIEPSRKDLSRKEKNRFTFEGDVLKRLDHHALPRVYRMFEDDTRERAYMLMDFVDGPNLDIVRRHLPEQRFTLSQVMTIMPPIVDAISYLHSQQPPIIHRDIKPSNIIVPDPTASVLVDFDIAKEFELDSTTTAIRRCSPGYGAPEQYGQGTSTLTDIYGLGATIYTLLTGQVPPDAFQRMTLLNTRGSDPLEPIDRLVPEVPGNVAEAVQRAMSLNSSDRYVTIEQFWQTFDTYATVYELPVPFVTPSTWSEALRDSHDVIEHVSPIQPQKQLSVIPLPLPLPPSPITQQPTLHLKQPRRRRGLVLALVLLVLFLVFGGAAGIWALFGYHQGVLSALPARSTPNSLFPSLPTVGLTPSLNPASTKIGGTVVVPNKVTASATPTRSTSSTSSTPIPSTSPTVISTMPPQPTPHPSPVPTPKPTPTPTPSPTPNPYPTLASAYNGTVVDTTATPNIPAAMYLSAIHQNRGYINGNFTVNAPLQGSGPFTGTVGTNKYIQFTVKGYNGHAPLYFWGFVQSNATLQGQYCSLDQNGHCSASVGAGGYWNVAPGA